MKRKCIIINADDCGASSLVDEHIEQAILAGKITSTTVIVNMDDFEGAVSLYKKYSDRISFGWHINLSEGKPLLYSQLLLDKGYYIEKDGGAEFNGKAFWKKKLTHEVKEAIRNELKAQYSKLLDGGIILSHADGHHHIHTSPSLMFLVPSLLEELGVKKMRRMRNYVPFSLDYLTRKFVVGTVAITHPHIKMTDTFSYFQEYIDNPNLPSGKTVELECHPGHPKYAEEEKILLNSNLEKQFGAKLISYKDL